MRGREKKANRRKTGAVQRVDRIGKGSRQESGGERREKQRREKSREERRAEKREENK